MRKLMNALLFCATALVFAGHAYGEPTIEVYKSAS
jgi:hypothetical protein